MENVSKMSLAGKKAWETRKKNLGEKSDVKIGQVKAGGVKKKRIGMVLSNGLRRVLRDSGKSIVLDWHEEVGEILWGRKYLEQILARKVVAKSFGSDWMIAGLVDVLNKVVD